MTNQNTNNKENISLDSINSQFELPALNKIDLESIPHLYGMSLKQYKEGLEIHSKCFNQMKDVKRIIN